MRAEAAFLSDASARTTATLQILHLTSSTTRPFIAMLKPASQSSLSRETSRVGSICDGGCGAKSIIQGLESLCRAPTHHVPRLAYGKRNTMSLELLVRGTNWSLPPPWNVSHGGDPEYWGDRRAYLVAAQVSVPPLDLKRNGSLTCISVPFGPQSAYTESSEGYQVDRQATDSAGDGGRGGKSRLAGRGMLCAKHLV